MSGTIKNCRAAAYLNNAMQPTANSIVFMRETRMVLRLKARRLMASVSARIELNSPSIDCGRTLLSENVHTHTPKPS
jgi:hypothetical protein